MNTIHYGTRARLGMLVPSSNLATEPQFHAMLPAGVSLHVTRLKLAGGGEKEHLGMTAKIEEATDLLADTHPDLVVFHCTAVSTFSTELERSIKERIARACGKPATATSEAIVTAFHALGAKRIVMLSPYVEATNAREKAFFADSGFDILDCAGLGISGAKNMLAVTPERWREFALSHRNERADAYLLSCTTVRSIEVAEQLERELGRPVVTSNTATAWHCLRKLGIDDRITGFGCLLAQH